MNHQDFISKDKSLLIAPAGYGKTYALAECLKYTPDNKKQLILTHTHAGIASIKEKIRAMDIKSSKYHIETISGFAQKYVQAFYCGSDKKVLGDDKFFNYIIEKSLILFKLESVMRIIKRSYKGLFVDEYQDCTMSQHNMIMLLAEVLPTHILGDPMQGIFNFDKFDPLVDFKEDLVDFEYRMTLDTPWRWNKEANNKQLGASLKEIRKTLESKNKKIKISSYEGITFHKINDEDIFDPSSLYGKKLRKVIDNKEGNDNHESLLILFPDHYSHNNINIRSNFRTRIGFSKQLILLEAFDDSNYYKISKNIDSIILTFHSEFEKIKMLKEKLFKMLFNIRCINDWFGVDNIKKRRAPHQESCRLLNNFMGAFIETPSLDSLFAIMLFLKDDLKLKTKRREMLNGILASMKTAITEETTVYEAMTQQKNILRRTGRKVHGKCIGTTHLTKGLEFDTVVVLDAHKFEDLKHFYVAITRACKKLVIFSETETLSFNK